MPGKVIACHQPNFLPWLGFFAKMARADAFVLLDDVQFTQGRSRHNWTTRVRIGTQRGPLWLSMPVRRSGLGPQCILDLVTDPTDVRWLPKMLASLEAAYGKTPCFTQTLVPLMAILERHDGSICRTNLLLIEAIAGMLGLRTRRVVSSALEIAGSGVERLINSTRALGGTTYLSGDGADDYQTEDGFRNAGIALRKLGFVHPRYPQGYGGDFVPGLSIVDALCHAGADATANLLREAPAHV
jgi:hypothetical protein